MFNVVGNLIFQQQAVSQLFGHEERRGVIGFWFDVVDVRGRSVRMAWEWRNWIRHWQQGFLAVCRRWLLLRVEVSRSANIFLYRKSLNQQKPLRGFRFSTNLMNSCRVDVRRRLLRRNFRGNILRRVSQIISIWNRNEPVWDSLSKSCWLRTFNWGNGWIRRRIDLCRGGGWAVGWVTVCRIKTRWWCRIKSRWRNELGNLEKKRCALATRTPTAVRSAARLTCVFLLNDIGDSMLFCWMLYGRFEWP